jgi:hypothetical protein
MTTNKDATSKGGRPGKYDTHVKPKMTLIEAWARDGLTDDQIAHNLGVNRTTFIDYKKKYPDLSDALKRGKEVVDAEVESALLKKAMGYNVMVQKTFKVKEVSYDDKGRRHEKEKLVTGLDEIHIPADTTAQIFWLKNRKPNEWRDKKDIEMSGKLVMFEDVDLDE